jgi:EAL domain-containing protein (putative c-di-GMP-specific phosphodiesterase class I)
MEKRDIVRQPNVDGQHLNEHCEVLATPVMLDSRMIGVVAIAAGACGEQHRESTLERLRFGCNWLTMLIRRESEAGRHYLATMLEMAAMFLEHRPAELDDAADPVVTRVIDALNGHLGTDTSVLLQQIHETVHHARGNAAAQTMPASDNGKLARDLSGALAANQFVLHYQPKVELETGRIVCMEALLRWEHPESGLLAPGRFLPDAERAGLMPAIDEWVLRSACLQLHDWHSCGHNDLSVAVNLSAGGFIQPHLVRQLLSVTREYAIAPERLEIEVTESTVMDNIDIATCVMRSLHDSGIRISIDDFGTGYSSLNYLQRFPISTIKINRSFVSDITSDTDIATIVRGIIAMAHATGLEVIADGVETEAQLAFLRQLKCDQIQGYLFSRPLEPGAAGQLLEMETTGGSLLDVAEQVS